LSCYTEIIVYRKSSTGPRRLRGCLKLQIIFRKRATHYTALLQKMTYEDKASYGSSPHCNCCVEPLKTQQHIASHCVKLQHAATHGSTRQHVKSFASRPLILFPLIVNIRSPDSTKFIATHCYTLQHVKYRASTPLILFPLIITKRSPDSTKVAATHSSTLQHTAAHCNARSTLRPDP